MPKPLRIWCNVAVSEAQQARLVEGVSPHHLDLVGSEGEAEKELARADIAFGQPSAAGVLDSSLRWLAVSSAGFTRYDTVEFRETFRQQGRWMTNASSVFAEPCAQHVLALMLAQARQLPQAWRDQADTQGWQQDLHRRGSSLLTGQSALFLGFGAIGRRLAELLAPFRMRLYAVRRRTYSEPGVHIISEDRVSSVLGQVDHVINLLPDNDSTHHYVNARRLSWVKRAAVFYNIGRGATVDQPALAEALRQGKLRAAYLDVTTPEPLPPHHELWSTPNCYITPHTAGGHHDEQAALVGHFLENFRSFAEGKVPAIDRVL